MNLYPKKYEFVIARKEIIKLDKVDTILLSTCSRATITLNNVIYIPRCDSNLISLGQLQEAGSTYHDYPKQMMLKHKGNIIRSVSRFKNSFILNTKTNRKMMMIQGRE